MTKKGQPPDDPSSAPESGTVRDETSGNNPAKGQTTQFTPPADEEASTDDPRESKAHAGRDTQPDGKEGK